jgi:hypothetical protein
MKNREEILQSDGVTSHRWVVEEWYGSSDINAHAGPQICNDEETCQTLENALRSGFVSDSALCDSRICVPPIDYGLNGLSRLLRNYGRKPGCDAG